jgi:hypothetical protein
VEWFFHRMKKRPASAVFLTLAEQSPGSLTTNASAFCEQPLAGGAAALYPVRSGRFVNLMIALLDVRHVRRY